MNKNYIDFNDLQTLIFERKQIVALLDDTELWQQIPLIQRFAIVDSCEFVALMGPDFTESARRLLEDEVEARMSTIH